MAYGGRGGFGMGGGMNMQAMMKQAQKLQEQVKQAQEELKNTEVEGSAGGMVTVTMTGDKRVTKVSVKPEAVDPDDIEMLEDLIVAATNEAFHQMEAESSAVMSELTGGLGNLGGLSF